MERSIRLKAARIDMSCRRDCYEERVKWRDEIYKNKVGTSFGQGLGEVEAAEVHSPETARASLR